MKIAVIILNWNGEKKGLLRRFLPSVVKYTPADVAQVVVADNGSDDRSLELLAAEFSSVQVLALGQNYGFAEGYNRAIGQLSQLREKEQQSPLGYHYEVQRSEAPELVVLLNDDVCVTPGWLDPMLAYMEAHRDCAAVQPKLLKYRPEMGSGDDLTIDALSATGKTTGTGRSESFEYAGACGGYLDELYYPYCRGRIFDTVEEDHGQYDLPEGEAWPVMWTSGACMMVRTDLYQKAGGLDARFFAHMEEIDLCWRLRRMGYDLACVPQSCVYHQGAASLPQGDPRKTKLNFRNSLVMMWKNLPSDQYHRLITRRKMLDGVAAMNFLRKGQWGNFRAVYQAHREADKMIATEYNASELVGFGKAKPFMNEQFSILWKYYKKGIKRYSELSGDESR